MRVVAVRGLVGVVAACCSAPAIAGEGTCVGIGTSGYGVGNGIEGCRASLSPFRADFPVTLSVAGTALEGAITPDADGAVHVTGIRRIQGAYDARLSGSLEEGLDVAVDLLAGFELGPRSVWHYGKYQSLSDGVGLDFSGPDDFAIGPDTPFGAPSGGVLDIPFVTSSEGRAAANVRTDDGFDFIAIAPHTYYFDQGRGGASLPAPLRVSEGDAVPRDADAGGRFGNAFGEIAVGSLAISATHTLFTAIGTGFSGVYTLDLDGTIHVVGETFGLAPERNRGSGPADFDGAGNVIMMVHDADGAVGLGRIDPDGEAPPQIIVPISSEVAPFLIAELGNELAVDGARAVMRGVLRGLNPLNPSRTLFTHDAMFEIDLDTGVVGTILEGGVTPIPGSAETLRIASSPGISGDLIAFLGFDATFAQRGLYAWFDEVLLPIVQVGDVIDGRTVKIVDFRPDAIDDGAVAYTLFFTDNTQGMYVTMLWREGAPPLANVPLPSTIMLLASGFAWFARRSTRTGGLNTDRPVPGHPPQQTRQSAGIRPIRPLGASS